MSPLNGASVHRLTPGAVAARGMIQHGGPPPSVSQHVPVRPNQHGMARNVATQPGMIGARFRPGGAYATRQPSQLRPLRQFPPQSAGSPGPGKGGFSVHPPTRSRIAFRPPAPTNASLKRTFHQGPGQWVATAKPIEKGAGGKGQPTAAKAGGKGASAAKPTPPSGPPPDRILAANTGNKGSTEGRVADAKGGSQAQSGKGTVGKSTGKASPGKSAAEKLAGRGHAEKGGRWVVGAASPAKGAGGKAASRGGDAAAAAHEAVDKGRVQKVKVLAGRMLDEWASLPKELQSEAFSEIAGLFSARVPPDILATLAPGALADARRTGDETAIPFAASSIENMQALLQIAGAQTQQEWAGAWYSLGLDRKDHAEALTNLLQAQYSAMPDTPDLAPRLMAELARTKAVSTAAAEEALKALGGKLEELIVDNEVAWHFLAYVLLHFFPKTASSSWGLQLPGWAWTAWWGMVERILAPVDSFRSFDILVMVLQHMQEMSGQAVKHLQVFKDGGRARMVRNALCKWSDMDNASILDTLGAYGVEL